MKGYIVLQKGFEYNDEVYSETESGGGHPQKIYFNRETALEEVKRLNIKEFKETNISLYSYDIEDICEDIEELLNFCNSLKEKYGEIQDDDEKKVFRRDVMRLMRQFIAEAKEQKENKEK